jgi:aminopeptidase N
MKNLYLAVLILLTFCNTAFSQEDYIKTQDRVVEMERASHARFISRQMSAAEFVNSSNNFDIHYYRCEWYINPSVLYVSGKITSYFTITASASSVVFDLSKAMTVDSVYYHGQKISFSADTALQTVQVNFPAAVNQGSTDSLSIYYQGQPDDTGRESFTNSFTHDGYPVIWTLSEPYGARDWWPCKNGLNDKTDSIDIIITSPSAYRASSNGLLTSEVVNGSDRITHYKHRYPIATYLVALSVTSFVSFTDYIQLGSVNLPFDQFVYPFAESYYRDAAFRVIRSMKLFHDTFGEYPFIKERYAQTEWRVGGGMEHQTNSFIADVWDGLVAHELAHQWFGDKITCGSWQDIWLNEGFASFLTNFNEENFYTYEEYMVTRRSQLKNIVSKPDGSVYVDDTTNVSRIFSNRLTYNKGAWLLRMLRWKLGDSAFFKGMRSYLNDPAVAFKYARSQDFIRNMEASSKQNLTEFFADWLYGQGYPTYQLKWMPMSGGWVRTLLSQTTSHNSVSFYEMPVPVKFKKGNQEAIIIIDHKKNDQFDYSRLGFVPDSAFIDPDLMLISANNTVNKITENASGPNTVVIFPNPVQDQFYVYLRNFSSTNVSITLHNSIGQLIWSSQLSLTNGGDFITVPSSRLAGGIYWIRVKGENVNVVKKVLK